MAVEQPPIPLQSQLIKAWIFSQNSDGTFSPASFSGGGGGGNVNLTGINGTAPGLTNPLAVELSDGTNPFGTLGNPVNVTLHAETTKVIGTVNQGTSPWVISGAVTATDAATGPTGSAVPVNANYKGLNVAGTLRGATGVNPSGSIFAQQVDLASILGVTIVASSAGVQKVGISGAAGVTLDAVLGAAKPANVLQVGGNDGTNTFALPLDSGGGAIVADNARWGATAVTAAAATSSAGAEIAPVVRSTPRKFGQILTQANLIISGVYTSAWFDTNASGTAWVFAQAFSNVGSGTNGFTIQTTDDTTNANTQNSIAARGTVSAGVLFNLSALISSRYWRIVYTNGGTATTTLEITSTEYTNPPANIYGSNSQGGSLIPATVTSLGALDVAIASANAGDGAGQQALTNQNGSGFFPGMAVVLTTGAANSSNTALARTPVVFKTASIAATSTTTASNPVWTPAAGKKFRLMRFQITAQGLGVTTSAAVTITLVDGATTITIGTYDVDIPAAANVVSGVNQISGGWIDLGNGFLSAAANNILNFGISAAGAGTTGTYRINVCGTEE